MTSNNPGTSRQPATLDTVATDAAAIIRQGRDAGLTPPFSLHCHAYGPPSVTLHLSAYDTADIWAALRQWAGHCQTKITRHPGATPDFTYATASFTRNGIKYDIAATIRIREPDDGQADEDGQAAGNAQPGTGQAGA